MGRQLGRAHVPARREDVFQAKGVFSHTIIGRPRLRKQTDRGDAIPPGLAGF
jgi:hypothetical protein